MFSSDRSAIFSTYGNIFNEMIYRFEKVNLGIHQDALKI